MHIKKKVGMALIGVLTAASLRAEPIRQTNEDTCRELLQLAETTPTSAPYDLCGFSDPDLAWNKWAPFASKNNLRRALFELCQRYPAHDYGALYCRKAEDLGYPPALIKAGIAHLKGNRIPEAQTAFRAALTDAGLQKADEAVISEQLGKLYTTQNSPYFNPRVGIPLLQKGAGLGSALANNILGFLSTWGQMGVPQDTKEGLLSYWRAALLGCSAAEENIGLLHLVRQNRLPPQQGFSYMMQQAWTCEPLVRRVQDQEEKLDCDCVALLESARAQESQAYRLIQTDGEQVLLRDKAGNDFLGRVGQKLENGVTVIEVGADYAVILMNGQRSFLQLSQETPCQTYCRRFKEAGGVIEVKPYRFTFTPNECEDIYFYAAHLIGLDHDFVGKKECARAMGQMDEASRLLLEAKKQEELDALSSIAITEFEQKSPEEKADASDEGTSQTTGRPARFAMPEPEETETRKGRKSRRRTK